MLGVDMAAIAVDDEQRRHVHGHDQADRQRRETAQIVSKHNLVMLKLFIRHREDEQDETVRSRRQSYAKLSPPRSA
jgi:hypothetical protein